MPGTVEKTDMGPTFADVYTIRPRLVEESAEITVILVQSAIIFAADQPELIEYIFEINIIHINVNDKTIHEYYVVQTDHVNTTFENYAAYKNPPSGL